MNGIRPIRHNLQRIGYIGPFERPFHKENIVEIVLNQQHGR